MDRQGPRVPLVGDEESIQQTLSAVLPLAGYTVYQVRDGIAGLGRERGIFLNDVIWPYMRRYRNFEKRQAFREAVAVANTTIQY